ncbi:MAG: glycosyltransferase family 39 protein [Planctomycetota bacterium]
MRTIPRPTALAAGLALLLALFAGLRLGRIVAATRWAMDADEAVHAVEALRLYEHLEAGHLLAFARDSYFPAPWHPPVDPHLRWYPPVHAWCVAPVFALLGPSDFATRLPSVLLLLGTCAVSFALARRLARPRAPDGGAASGLLAVVLLLSAPNLLTFSAQSLADGAAVFFCFLAVLAYLRSLERGHPRGRALLAGLALGAAVLTKYDHGGWLALCLGVAELLRVRFSLRALFRSGAGAMLLLAGGIVVLWFAHPAKLAALGDSLRHPFLGTPRTILLDFLLTWIVEYAPGLAVGLLAFAAAIAFARRRGDPAVRAVWLWAVASAVFYAVRGRYHFRYNLVEAPIFLLFLAVALPEWVRSASGRLAAPRAGAPAARGLLLWFGGALGAAAGLVASLAPARALDLVRGPLAWLHGLRADHWGMRLAPGAYVDDFAARYSDFVSYLGGSLAAAAIGVFLLGAAMLLWRHLPAERRHARTMTWAALGVAAVPGIALLHLRLPGMVEWELEGHPELADVHQFVVDHVTPGDVVLLGGGWDQLTNNGLSWYRATRAPGGRIPLAAAAVTGDMIGSVVFPPEPRIAHWAVRLATAPAAELPRFLVLAEPGPAFLYRTFRGPEVAIYGEIVHRRGSYHEVSRAHFPLVDVTIRILRRDGDPPPLAGYEDLLAAAGIDPAAPAASRAREEVGAGGWTMRDEALRHFAARLR